MYKVKVIMRSICAILVLVPLVYAKIPPCEVPCTRELNRVCGTDGQSFKIFNNPCLLGNQHCKDGHHWFQTRMNECNKNVLSEAPCEEICTRELNPVCGTDGQHFRIFNNPCLLRNQHCEDGRHWFQTRNNECNEQFLHKKRCEKPCTKERRPVCGTDGEHFKIFSNACVMSNQHCKDGHNWIQTRMEKCN